MAITITVKGGNDAVTVSDTARIGFFGTNFGDSIVLNNYQSSTFVTNIDGTLNSGELPNIKYISNSLGMGDIGSGSAVITSFTPTQCTLHISFTSGSASRVQAVKLLAYSGSISSDVSGSLVATGMSNATVMGFERGDINWTVMSGSTSPLMLSPYSGAAGQMTHDYYVGLSAQPQKQGINTNVSLALYGEWY